MLSPRAIRLFIRYIDSLDEALSRRMVRKRTWDEEALTFLFTELMDLDGQQDHRLSYSHDDLLKGLAETDEPLSFDVRIDTHSYPKSVERWVTQSDLGMIIDYQDQFSPEFSFRSAWLMQAKRLFPSRARFESGFTANSGFDSFDSSQHGRMKQLRDWAGCDFIRYLLYCPRPQHLDRSLREQLCHARTSRLGGEIFDYTLGLELRDDLLSISPTTAAGIFVVNLDDFPPDFLSVHKKLFLGSTPFSWFIAAQLADRRDGRGFPGSGSFPGGNLNNSVVEGLVKGDAGAIEGDPKLREVLEDSLQMRLLPAHTITVRVIQGTDRPGIRKHD